MEQDRLKPKILVIDDNGENRALARATLEDEDYEVITAATGEEGIHAFETERPDCVLLDVRMPGTDGFAVCSRIRGTESGAHTPIVFVTALRDIDTFERALRAGGDDFLTKPVRPTELLVRVQAAVKLGRMSEELREHYALVKSQRDAMMRLQLQKERLTAFVVHDLKNPLNSLDLHAQLLLADPELPVRARESAAHIRSEARSLLRLVLNLLDISKSEEGQLVPQLGSVDLETLTGEVTLALALQARSRGVTLERHLEVRQLCADADLLRRLLENLLDNAIRHAPEGTSVNLSAIMRGGCVEIRVADAGPGIPLAMREQVFERFAQLDSAERAVTRTGRGLGLAFCKLVAEAHRGSIEIEDASPGAVFCVRLPHVQ